MHTFGPCMLFSYTPAFFVIVVVARIQRLKNSHLYHLLRPEALLANNVPLNSDSYSNFKASTEEDDRELREATQRVLNVEIPRLARAIEQGEVLVVNSKQLVNELHKRGINVR